MNINHIKRGSVTVIDKEVSTYYKASALDFNHKKDLMKDKIKFLVWTLYPLLITFLVELLQRGTVNQTFRWLVDRPMHVLLGYLIIFLFFMLIICLTSVTWLATAVTGVIFLTAALVNYFKIIVRGDPFVPWDMMLSKELNNIMEHIKIQFTPLLCMSIIIVILCMIGTLFIKEKKISVKRRLIFSTAVLMGVFLCFKTIYLNPSMLKKVGVYDANWSQIKNYEYNGFLVGFLINIKNVMIDEPEDYTENEMKKLINNSNQYPNHDVKPNIIMIMNESFWDPTKLPGVEFSEDPIPTVNKLRKEAMSGWILSQQYGGGTANTEFEVLTGNGMMFLPTGSMAYQQYVKKPMPSLASFLKSEGYRTVAVHSYEKWFWNREDVYPLIGFDKFVSNSDFKNPEIRGNFISDSDTAKRVISEYEAAQNEEESPFFGFAVTMQNHAPYDDKTYPERTIKAHSEEISDEANTMINNYVQGAKDADDALNHLIDYFEKRDEPTIIVMFGDHLPMLGNDYKVYKETGYLGNGEWGAKDYIDMYTTPFVAWNNYELHKEDVGIINAHYLAPTLLGSMNVDMPIYFNYLLDLKKEIPVYSDYVCIDEKGSPQLKPSPAMEELKKKHWIFQYDMMFGKGYMTQELYKKE
ncbi:MAG: sulfatase [Clostridia bacterium]|jgi:phosphoglycerol transferase MdoB-like AlkP superfamily enzyme|nr:sulfatase [Clostridia bacterium]